MLSNGNALPKPGSVKVGRYWSDGSTAMAMSATCGNKTVSNQIVAVPYFQNYAMATATANGVNGTIGSPVNAYGISMAGPCGTFSDRFATLATVSRRDCASFCWMRSVNSFCRSGVTNVYSPVISRSL